MIDNPILMLNSLYRKLAVLLHPDKNNSMVQAEEAFKCVTQAYTVLLDPVKRQQLFFNRVTPASPNEPISRKSGTNVYQNTDTVQYKMYNTYCNKLLKKIDETSPVISRRTLSPAVSRTASSTPLDGMSPATKRKREEEEMVKGTKKLKITDLRSSTSTHHDESSSSGEEEASDSSSRSKNSLRQSQKSSTEELSFKRGKSAVAGGPGAGARAAHSSPANTTRSRVSITDINQFITQKIRQVKDTQEDEVRLNLFENLQHKFGDGPTATSTSTTSLRVSGNGQTGSFSQVTTHTFSFNQAPINSPKVTPKSDLNTLLTNYMTQVPVITTVSASSTNTSSPSYNFLNPHDPILLNSLRKSQSRTVGPHTNPVAVYSSPVSSAPSTPNVASPTVPHAGFEFNLFASQSPVTPKVEPRTTAGQNSTSSINTSFQATITNLLNDSTNTTLTSILTSPVTSPPVIEAASDASTDTSAPMTL
jgi:curved DNA-binding protein CbpA